MKRGPSCSEVGGELPCGNLVTLERWGVVWMYLPFLGLKEIDSNRIDGELVKMAKEPLRFSRQRLGPMIFLDS